MINLKNKFTFPGLLSRIFNKPNLNKILIVFVIGLTSRIFINYIYNINVFIDYFNKVSIIYYILMSMFIVLIHEIVTYFDFNIIPSFIFDSIKFIISMNSKIFNILKLKDYSIFSIRKLLKETSLNNFNAKFPMTQVNMDDNISKDVPDSNLDTKVLSRSNKSSSHKNKSSSNNSSSSSSANSNTNRTSNVRANRINSSNTEDNWIITRNRTNNTRELAEHNQNNPSSQNNWQDHRVSNNNVYFNLDDVVSAITNYNNSPIPRTRPPAPNPYSNLTTPSTIGPSENFDNNSPRRSTNSTYQNKSQPVDTSEMTNNANGYSNVDSSYRDSYRLQNTTYAYIPNSYASNSYAPNPTQPAIPSTPVSPAPVTAPVPAPAQDSNGPISSELYQNLPDANQFAAAATYAPINTDPNQVPITRALINNPRPVQSYVTSSNVHWNYYRNQIQNNFEAEIKGYSDKEVLIPDKGIKGKLKVCFRYLDEKMHSADSVYVTFKDKSKRKFIWTLWESKSGNYESYKDFKESWNPDTSIFKEIKDRTRKDMRADIEAIIGVNRNTRGILGNTMQNRIEPITTTREVRNLVRDNDPFNNHTSSANDSARVHNNNATDSSNTGDPETRQTRHKRKHSHSSSNHSSNHSSNYNHGHRHKRSHGHGKSHNYERRRK